ncbi:MAG: secondary thiamine-phosphate synthase enzyme YjbQ [Spirochaetes bacterium]|nr:secondary thiamine-phosphate synthase enzyme YjbQ [Spirochaetota bacterium]
MVVTAHIEVSTKGRRDVIDITGGVQDAVANSGMRAGTVTVFVTGSTAALTTIEYEPGLVRDIDIFLENILPYGGKYRHHEIWHDDNGAAHLQAALLGPSITVPFTDGKLTLGTWQQVVLVDCDTRPRSRKLVAQMMGE